MTLQHTATGTFSNGGTLNITTLASWTVSDSTIATIDNGASKGVVTFADAGKIWGGDIGVTATLSPGTPGTSSLLVIASDSSSISVPWGLVHMPQQNNHWVALGIPPWGTWFGCQEATGTLVGSGSVPYDLIPNTPAGSSAPVQYAQQVESWLRTAVWLSGSINTRFSAAVGVGPNIAATSVAYLGYAKFEPGLVNNTLYTYGTGLACRQPLANSGKLQLLAGSFIKDLTGPITDVHGDRVHPILFVYNISTAEIGLYSDVALAFSGSSAARTDAIKGLGGSGVVPLSSSFLFFASATGSIVNHLTSPSGAADFLTRLGWTVAWKDCPTDSGSIKLPFLPHHWTEIGQSPWTAAYNLEQSLGTNVPTYDRWDGVSIVGADLLSNAMSIGNAIPGWNRKAYIFNQTANQRVQNTLGFVEAMTTSVAYLCYNSYRTVSADNRSVHGQNASTIGGRFMVQYGTAGVPQLNCSGTITDSSADHRDGRVHPTLIVYDRTNSLAKLYTDLVKHTGTFNDIVTAGTKGIGGTSVTTSGEMDVVYWAVATGSVAEALSDDGRASEFLKDLGWNPPW